MLLFCICISEKKIWILPSSKEVPCNINVSLKSKYDKYLIINEEISSTIEKYSEHIIRQDLETIMLPVNPLQQREQEYARKRESVIPFLEYVYPEIQGGIYDFVCNGKKVQEKVLGLHRKSMYCTFARNDVKKDGKRQQQTYMVGENEYYWFHSSVDDCFWIVPEGALIEKGYITVTKSKKRYINFSNTQWDLFKYNYKEIDEEKIKGIFL